MKGRRVWSTALDLLAGFLGAAAVIVATDATNADLRVYFVASVAVFFAIGFWRAGSEGAAPWVRVLLICLFSVTQAVQLLARHWPPDWLGLSYAALYPALQWVSASAGFALRRRPQVTTGQRWLALAGAVAASTIVAALTMPAYSRLLATDTETRPLPEFAFETFDSVPVSTSDWRGKVVVLDFWASWCLPCVAELGELEELYQQYRNRDDVVFWAVGAQDEREKAARFVSESPYSLPWAYDPGDAAFTALEARTVPSLYLIDRQGQIRLTHVGYSAAEGFLEHVGGELQELLAEPTGPVG
jgi:thiol-disulfide isomerase/thioredoxin